VKRLGLILAAALVAAGAAQAAEPQGFSFPLTCGRARLMPAATAERIVFFCDQGARVIETPSGRIVRAFAPGEVREGGVLKSSAFSPLGDLLAIALQDGTVLLWDIDKPGPPRRWKAPHYPTTLLFTPAGRGLFVDEVLLDLGPALAPRTRLATDFDTISDVAVSPDGKRAAVAAADTKVRLYETAGWRPVAEFGELRVEPFTALFVNGGRRLLVGAADGRVYVLDGKTLQRQAEVAGPPGYNVRQLNSAGAARVAVLYMSDDGRGRPKVALLDLKTLTATPQPDAAKADAGATRGGRLWLYRMDGETLHGAPLP
jgi:WD40 repeat protein